MKIDTGKTNIKKGMVSIQEEDSSPEYEISSLKYKRTGVGRIVAILMTILFFLAAPPYMRMVFKFLMYVKDTYFKNGGKFQFYANLIHLFYVQIVANLIFSTIYFIEHPFFERYKIGNQPWPWKQPEKWKTMKYKTYALVFFNALIITPCLAYLPCLGDKCKNTNSWDEEDLPDALTFFLQVIFCTICEDFFFHMGHRLLHWKPIYPIIHKVHHQYQFTIAPAATYAHPIEYLFGNLYPTLSGALILGKHMHFVAGVTWTFIRLLKAYDNHSGYDFSFSPFKLFPMQATSQYHDFHHSQNIGNYSSFLHFWDTILGSNTVYYQYLKEQQDKNQNNQSKTPDNKNKQE